MKRYNIVIEYNDVRHKLSYELDEHDNGDVVLFVDAQTELAEKDALIAQLTKERDQARVCGSCYKWNDTDDCPCINKVILNPDDPPTTARDQSCEHWEAIK